MLAQIRHSPAIPKTIKLNIDLSKAGAGMSAAAVAADDGDSEESTNSAVEHFAIAAGDSMLVRIADQRHKCNTPIVLLIAGSWGYELVATSWLATRTGT